MRAVRPVIDAVGAEIVSVEDSGPDDIPLVWRSKPVAAVRLPEPQLSGALDRLIAATEAEFGASLGNLSREDKQRAVRRLEERGAFTIRKSVEAVAEALEVSRFTVYNYLNREAAD